MRLAPILIVLPFAALAQAGLRAGDTLLSRAEMLQLLSGHVVEFYDGSKSRYGADRAYAYTYTDDGPAWTGTYTVDDDSLVCVVFDNGLKRCDRYVRDGDRVILIIDDGTRFPVRNLSVYEN